MQGEMEQNHPLSLESWAEGLIMKVTQQGKELLKLFWCLLFSHQETESPFWLQVGWMFGRCTLAGSGAPPSRVDPSPVPKASAVNLTLHVIPGSLQAFGGQTMRTPQSDQTACHPEPHFSCVKWS